MNALRELDSYLDRSVKMARVIGFALLFGATSMIHGYESTNTPLLSQPLHQGITHPFGNVHQGQLLQQTVALNAHGLQTDVQPGEGLPESAALSQ